MVFSSYFLWKGLNNLFLKNKKDLFSFLISGIIFGIGFYTYTSFRMAVPLFGIILVFLALLAWKEKKLKRFLCSSLVFFLATLLVALPIGIHFFKNPQYFSGRASQVFFFNQPNPIQALIKSILLHLGMFNFYGDQNWRHNLPSSPQLWPPIGILFLIGLFFVIKKTVQNIKQKSYYSLICYLFILSWFIVLLAPGFLTSEGIPHSLRSIGTIPIVYLFASIGLYLLYQWLKTKIKNKEILQKICLSFIVIVTIAQGYKYFIKWGKNEETQGAFCKPLVEIGRYLNSLPPNIKTVVIVNRNGVPVPWPEGIPMPAQTVMFIENTKYQSIRSQYLLPEKIDKIKAEESTIIVPLGYDQELFNRLENLFPEGKIKKINNNFSIYKI